MEVYILYTVDIFGEMIQFYGVFSDKTKAIDTAKEAGLYKENWDVMIQKVTVNQILNIE